LGPDLGVKEARILLMPGLIATPEDEKTAGKAYLFLPDGLADLWPGKHPANAIDSISSA
jgi:hypothetical protein